MKFKITVSVALAALLWITTSMCSSGTDSPNAAETSVKSTSENTGIKWYGYDEGMAIGKKEGKKILINFFANWCTYCKKMDRDTFSKSDVAAYMNEHFIAIKLNSDIEKQLSEEFRVSGLPTTWFVDKDGEKIQGLPGYLNREMFLAYLKYIQSDSYRNMSFRKFMSKK
jgi:thioredoxin-related protein